MKYVELLAQLKRLADFHVNECGQKLEGIDVQFYLNSGADDLTLVTVGHDDVNLILDFKSEAVPASCQECDSAS